jgi:hypothetical protein
VLVIKSPNFSKLNFIENYEKELRNQARKLASLGSFAAVLRQQITSTKMPNI